MKSQIGITLFQPYTDEPIFTKRQRSNRVSPAEFVINPERTHFFINCLPTLKTVR